MAYRLIVLACLGALIGFGCTPASNEDDGGGGSGGTPQTDGAPADMAPEPEPDMAPEPEPDMAPPDMAPEPDMAPPDMAPPEPDMAPPEPDMAPPEPDMAPPEPDMAPPPACEDDDFEDDDRPIDAVVLDGLDGSPVGEGQSVDRRLCGGDDDVYAVDGCANGRLEAELRFAHAEGDLSLAVVDLFGAVLARGESATDDELAGVDLVDGAPVFVRVSGGEGVATGYTLRLVRTCPECIIDADCGRGALCDGLACAPGECRADADCPGEVCVDRACVRCGDDADCPDGVCVDAVCIGCRGDEDCGAGVCEGAQCVQCRGDGDCRAGVCVDAVCVGCGDDADCPGGVCVDESCAGCRGDADCPDGVCADGACVRCRGDADCPDGVCADAQCVQCRGDGDCPDGVCADDRCVECAADGDCAEGVCVAEGCVECRDAGQCPGGVCDANRCVQCAGDGDCPGGVCVGNGCVECRGDGDCDDGVCADNACAQCRGDGDCPDGVCADQRCIECAGDGDCAGGVCEGARCVQCRGDADCVAGVCEGAVCVGCGADADCPAGVCVDAVCAECRDDAGCLDGVCAAGACVQCADDGDCPDGVCADATCVECRGDGDCANGVCDGQRCVPCRADGDCAIGVCADQRCVLCRDDGDCPDGVCVVEACVECRGVDDCAVGQACDGGECVEVACADPTFVPPGVAVEVVTTGAADDIQGSCGGGSPDRALIFVAPAAGPWCISTEGSDYDTLIFGFAGSCAGPEIGCNDDAEELDIALLSAFTFQAEADGRYLFIVDGFSGVDGPSTGTATVRVTPGACGAADGPRGPAPGELVITELLPDPSAVTDNNGEWFELYNNSDDALDLEGVLFAEADGGNDFVIEGTLIVQPRGYLVLGKNADAAANGGVELDYAYGGDMALGNGADDVQITNVEGQLVDSVAYDGGGEWPDPTGASMQLDGDPAEGDNGDPARWCTATQPFGDGDLGSPGLANPPCP